MSFYTFAAGVALGGKSRKVYGGGFGTFSSAPTPVATPATTTAPAAGGVPSTTQGAPMSMLGDVGRALAPYVGSYFGGETGEAIGTKVAQVSAANRVAAPGVGVMPVMGALPRIAGALGTIGGTMVGAGVLGARTIMRSAVTYCRRHPAWCSQIGGTAAIAGMIQGGQLPAIRRRRARGISPSDFRGFKRVHKILSGFCAPRMRVRTKARRA